MTIIRILVTTLIHSMKSIPMKSIPLKSIPLKSIPLKSIPMKSIPLKSIPMKSIPLKSIPMKSIPLKSIPLKSIPMKSIPMKSIPMKTIPMKCIPMKTSMIWLSYRRHQTIIRTLLRKVLWPREEVFTLSLPIKTISMSTLLEEFGTVVQRLCPPLDHHNHRQVRQLRPKGSLRLWSQALERLSSGWTLSTIVTEKSGHHLFTIQSQWSRSGLQFPSGALSYWQRILFSVRSRITCPFGARLPNHLSSQWSSPGPHR